MAQLTLTLLHTSQVHHQRTSQRIEKARTDWPNHQILYNRSLCETNMCIILQTSKRSLSGIVFITSQWARSIILYPGRVLFRSFVFSFPFPHSGFMIILRKTLWVTTLCMAAALIDFCTLLFTFMKGLCGCHTRGCCRRNSSFYFFIFSNNVNGMGI